MHVPFFLIPQCSLFAGAGLQPLVWNTVCGVISRDVPNFCTCQAFERGGDVSCRMSSQTATFLVTARFAPCVNFGWRWSAQAVHSTRNVQGTTLLDTQWIPDAHATIGLLSASNRIRISATSGQRPNVQMIIEFCNSDNRRLNCHGHGGFPIHVIGSNFDFRHACES